MTRTLRTAAGFAGDREAVLIEALHRFCAIYTWVEEGDTDLALEKLVDTELELRHLLARMRAT